MPGLFCCYVCPYHSVSQSDKCRYHSHRKTGGQAKKHTNTGLLDVKTVVLIFFHSFRTRYPDLFGMAEPDTVRLSIMTAISFVPPNQSEKLSNN